MMEYESFFMEEVPLGLKKLKEEDAPRWGRMSAREMLDHLRTGIRMSLENLEGEILTPEEKLGGYKKFLMSDRPFAPNLDQPQFYTDNQQKTEKAFEDLKVELMKALVEMQAFFEKNEEHTAVHPSFGRLGTLEWKQLHKKHILHHFRQFGLI